MKGRGSLSACLAAISFLLLATMPAHAIRIKLATLAPQNFESSKIVKQMTDEIEAKTHGQVQFKIYYGGVKGTGRDLLLKIKAGEIQGGQFTAGEASSVCPDLRVMSIPLAFQSYDKVDFVMARMEPIFRKQLEGEGFVVLGWVEVGFAYPMSTEPIASLADMKGKKVWVPVGNPVAKAAFEAMGVHPIPFTIADVMVALQTGQINTVTNSFAGAVALQWYTRVKYITDKPLLYIYGLLMITKDAFDNIPSEYQGTVKEIAGKYFAILKADMRKNNSESRETLIKQGLKFVPVSPANYQQLKNVIGKVNQELIGKDFSDAALQEMQKFTDEYRVTHPGK